MQMGSQPKKLILYNILDILRKYSDADHRLSQKEIQDILYTEYGMKTERKAVKRNLMNLIDLGYDLEYSDTIRMTPVKDPQTGETTLEESYVLSDFYLQREFTDGELRLLIDSLLFSKHIPYSQCKELVEKLEGLSNIYFRSRVKHISKMPEDKTDSKQLFLNIELLDEAIGKHQKVSFKYTEYGTDKQEHLRIRPDGSAQEYVVSPYQMVTKEGKYYLICNYDKYDDISNYRLDRIREIKILDEIAKPFEKLTGASGQSLDLAAYMREHVYMFSSENTWVKFRASKSIISDVIDMFGKDVKFTDETENAITVSVKANEMSAEQFAKSFAPDIIVLEPKSLADRVQAGLRWALQGYEKAKGEKEHEIL